MWFLHRANLVFDCVFLDYFPPLVVKLFFPDFTEQDISS